jgi:hypothetical protein
VVAKVGGTVDVVADLVREDFERIARLKSRAIDLKRPAKKSELLRAGLQTLERLDDAGLLVVLNALQSIKTGRPKKRH